MFIKSIVLDGFKSYGNRVEITGFDPEFNAITGLNGTGKSNILDSICFVLGITNLSNVRAGSLQELIYKHGQAGITKATVSITFDNRNRSQCPIGYENHDEITVTRQVVMGGKNRYLINGINVQNKRVSDLFCSIQLNVNNPHFLIMQGRITKVLNMKPPEILSMVEEAAGTRMYEAKKQAAQKTIEKKDAKLRELNDIIKEDIAPKLQKLQDERAQFQEYQKVVRELDNLTKLYVAWKYVNAEEKSKEAEDRVKEVREEIIEKKQSIKNNEKETKSLEQQVQDLSKKLDEESGNCLKQLEGELSGAEKCESKCGAEVRAARDNLSQHEKRARLLQGALSDDSAALAHKRDALDKLSRTFESLKSNSEAAEAALSAAQARYVAVSTGNEGDNHNLQDQLIEAKQQCSEASTRLSQISLEKKHCEGRLRGLEGEFAGGRAQYDADTKHVTLNQHKLAQIQKEMSGLKFDESRYSSMKERHKSLTTAVRGARDRREAAAGGLMHCDIQYSDPEPNFDRNRILGTVCRNFEVTDPKYCMALETAAGGRLYNVIVDTERTGRLLVDRGNLARRVTVIPLNQIRANVIDNNKLKLAQQIGGGPENVQLALDVISFKSGVAPAMRFVFGGTLLCRDLDVARKVTYHDRVRTRCVTLQGDVTDPGGSLSGGAAPKGEPVLVRLNKLREVEQELRALEEDLHQTAAALHQMQNNADTYQTLQQKYEMMSHELELAKTRIAQSSHGQLFEEITALKSTRDRLEQEAREVKAALEEATQRAASLQREVDDIQGHRDREFKKAEEALKKAKKEVEKYGSSWSQKQQEVETLRLEVEELEQSVAASGRQLEETSQAAAQLQEALNTAQQEHTQALAQVKEIQGRMKRHRSEMSSRSGEISKLAAKKDALLKQNGDAELQIKQLEYNVTELQTEAADTHKRIKSLENEYPWISEEKAYFGSAGGAYDFEGRQASSAGARVAALTAKRDKLGRGVNARAHTLLGKEEEQFQEVMRKKQIVEADRAKLVSVMEELDEKKRKTLVLACEQVNRDFGSIFSTLLPGAQARLQPPPAQTVLDGLEVQVGFNNTWKESLGELSGGQRSLVALSLVLAMLLFKPAPLYILDEVDAALDLSHTQNIGNMLKEHFTHSQFIVVSLKDGMFNNANVLFKTQFVDGMSSVQRTVNRR